MGQVSRQDFADLCGVDMDSLRTYISRKKVIVHGEKGKFIDTSNPINKAFRDKRKSNADSKKEMQDIIARIPVNQRKGKPDSFNDDEDDDNPLPESLSPEALLALFAGNKGGRQGKGGDDSESMQRYIKMKIKGDGELVAAKVIKENIQIEKLSGSLLPIDLVHSIQEVYCKSIFNSFENGCQNFASLICARLVNGDMTLYTQLVGELMAILQKCVDDAGRQAEDDIDRLIDEFSISKGRGEK